MSATLVQTLVLPRGATDLLGSAACPAQQLWVSGRKGLCVLLTARLRLTSTFTVQPQSSAGLRIVGNWAAAFNTAKANIEGKGQKTDFEAVDWLSSRFFPGFHWLWRRFLLSNLTLSPLCDPGFRRPSACRSISHILTTNALPLPRTLPKALKIHPAAHPPSIFRKTPQKFRL